MCNLFYLSAMLLAVTAIPAHSDFDPPCGRPWICRPARDYFQRRLPLLGAANDLSPDRFCVM